MDDIKISIIVTVYNIEEYIGECLESVLNQDIAEIEVICIDDASEDDSHKVLKEYNRKDDRIKIIHNEKNQGQASSRNKGCRQAKGEYLYIMDGDDYLIHGALKRLYDCAKTNHLDILTFSAESFTDDSDMILISKQAKDIYKRNSKYDKILEGAELLYELLDRDDIYGNLCLMFINRIFFEENQLYGVEGLRYNEDDPFAMYLKAKRAKCIPDILYMRRIRKGSVTMKQQEMCHLESAIIQYVHNLQMWQSCSLTKEQNRQIEKYFLYRHQYIKAFEKRVSNFNEEMTLLEKYPMAKYIYDYYISKKPIICKNLTQIILKNLLYYRNVIVYGAGTVAQETVNILEKHNILDYYIAVSERSENNIQFENKKVYKIDELKNMNCDAIVVVATMAKHYKAIGKKLQDLGFKNVVYVD